MHEKPKTIYILSDIMVVGKNLSLFLGQVTWQKNQQIFVVASGTQLLDRLVVGRGTGLQMEQFGDKARDPE